ncbi:glycosyltransferase family 2 protein [Priestia megaterium]|uniref:glycosyltransferase family 2 protein n=2 Tax=Priestia megaterium TaxID=1404 RepID=UPI000BFD3CAD|nr:glycosyltransferase family 2 protein [Priestia megaterium]PGO62600.1 hypothetical protein CN981_00260 [Priestia megaterium]
MCKMAVVILNYNNIKETLKCIEEFKKQSVKIEIIVVDNNSPDKSHEELQKVEGIHYIQTYENLGYAKGNNVGIKYAINNLNVSNIIISNNDIYFPNKNVIETLNQSIKALPANWGYIGTVIKDQNDHIYQMQPKSHTTLVDRIINSTLMGIPFRKLYNREPRQSGETEDIYESEIVSGAFFVLNTQAVSNIGAFDPYTFLYGEERILAKKYYKSGFKGYLTSRTYVIHKNSETTRKYPIISYVNSLKSEYYYFSKYTQLNLLKKSLLVWIRYLDTIMRIVIGNIDKKTFLEIRRMYIKVRKELE